MGSFCLNHGGTMGETTGRMSVSAAWRLFPAAFCSILFPAARCVPRCTARCSWGDVPGCGVVCVRRRLSDAPRKGGGTVAAGGILEPRPLAAGGDDRRSAGTPFPRGGPRRAKNGADLILDEVVM